MSAPDYNVNREPAVNHCDDDDFDCADPAHRIAAMYQTHDRVNVEIYDGDANCIKTIPLLTEADALDFMTDWIAIQRDKGKRNEGGPTYRVDL